MRYEKARCDRRSYLFDLQHQNTILHKPAFHLRSFEFFWHTAILSLIEEFFALNHSYFLVRINAKLYNMNNFHYHPSFLMEAL